jgi:branched-chain amino acid transport system substrate-binding protein
VHRENPGDPRRAVPELKIAFIEDLAPDGAAARTAPAFQGAKLAVDTVALWGSLPATVKLVALDVRGDTETARQVAEQIADDPAFVGAIGAPYLDDQEALRQILAPAGVPVLTLSGLGPPMVAPDWSTWRRAVSTQSQEGAALASYVDSLRGAAAGVCLANGGGQIGAGLLRSVSRAMVAPVDLRMGVAPTAADAAAFTGSAMAAGCRVVVWGGFSAGGASLRRSLVGAGLRHLAFVGGGGLKDETYLRVAGPEGGRTVASCPCVDLSTSTAFAAQRFIQDYQSDFGLPPGPYAAEAWDVTRMLLEAVRSGATGRSEVLAFLGGLDRYEGLAGTYVFGPDGGELAAGSAHVYLYEDIGGRWLPLQA